MAAYLRDFGVSEQAALDLMLDGWNDRCSPPWAPDELKHKVANAFAYGQNAPGSKSPTADFRPAGPGPEERAAPGALAPRGIHLEWASEIRLSQGRPYVVKGLLDLGGMSVVYGNSNTGKTFLALDISFRYGARRNVAGARVRKGAVIYVAAEGGGSVRDRVAAWRAHHQVPSASFIPFALAPCSVDLFSSAADTDALIRVIETELAKLRDATAPVLVVLDTLARVMAGGNENQPDAMGAVIRNVDRIRAMTGAHVMVVHHTGKEQAKGARGHSSLRAATDTEIEVTGDSGSVRQATVTKQRDHVSGDKFGFELRSVDLGVDEDGERRDFVRRSTGEHISCKGVRSIGPEERSCFSCVEDA